MSGGCFLIVKMWRCCSHSVIEARGSPKHTAMHRTGFTVKNDITNIPVHLLRNPI